MRQEGKSNATFAVLARELVHKPLSQRQPKLRNYEAVTHQSQPVRCVVLIPNDATGTLQQTVMICVDNRGCYVDADGHCSGVSGISPDDIIVIGIATPGYKCNPAVFGDFSCVKTLADIPVNWVVAYSRDSDYYLLWHDGAQVYAQSRDGTIQKWGAPVDSIQGFVLTDHVARERYIDVTPE